MLIRLSAKRVRHKARRAIQGENEARRECGEAGNAKKAAEERGCMAKKVAKGRRVLDAAPSTEKAKDSLWDLRDAEGAEGIVE